jgi:hypothetical protein
LTNKLVFNILNKKTMKKFLMSIVVLIVAANAIFAQNPNYVKAMESLVSEIQNSQFGVPLQAQANKMERIASAEKTEWLPNYWVAYCYLMDSFAETDGGKKDLLLDKADQFLSIADKINVKEEELEILRANLASARMSVSPQDRWQKYGQLSAKALGQAKSMNAENPRIALLEAQGIFYTPEAFGGGKDKAKGVFDKAISQFSAFKAKSILHPNWGENTTKYMLSQY